MTGRGGEDGSRLRMYCLKRKVITTCVFLLTATVRRVSSDGGRACGFMA